MTELKAQAVQPLLAEASLALQREQPQEAAPLLQRALEVDEDNGLAWHLLGICREKAGDFGGAMKCFEAALKTDPENPDVANDIGRLAFLMGKPDLAEQLFRIVVAGRPDMADGYNNLACALRDQMRYDEALQVLKPAIAAQPEHAILWNTLGTVVNELGEVEQALPLYAEAVRLEPTLAKARYNLATARIAMGDIAGALSDCEAALGILASKSEQAMMRFVRSTMLLAAGRVEEGWRAYEARLDPHYAEVVHYLVDEPLWTPQTDIEGCRLLLIGEQGLGDEVLFANVLPDVLEALGPDGELWVAVEPRLVGLFQRSFPTAKVRPHTTYRLGHRLVRAVPALEAEAAGIDLWAPLASPLQRFRPSAEAFPDRPAFLAPDPARVAHWRQVLETETAGPRIGLVWKSLKLNSARARFYSPFDAWAPVLRTPGLTLVNLQYGDCAEEIARAREEMGVEIWTPPGIDLKNDLDDLTALCCAMDLVIGPANATTNLAAAAGAPTWLITTPGAWPPLGTRRYPWYPVVRLFAPPAFNRWEPVMAEVAEALAQTFPAA
jgi:tetratricopeptide (TPR) repeat protein